MKTNLFALFFIVLSVSTFAIERAAGASEVITFSEFPVGTSISNQYQDIGITFGGSDGGSDPFIASDTSTRTSPVLSGTPRFQGDITGRFSEPGTDRPTVVQSFMFNAGYFDEFGTTRIEWFDPDGKKLGQRINSRFGIERFTIEGGNISHWRIGIVQNEPAGYAIDNVSFVPIGPSVLFRLMFGSVGSDGVLPAHVAGGHLEDVNEDGIIDLVSHYPAQETGIVPGVEEACVTAKTTGGQTIKGCDRIHVIGS